MIQFDANIILEDYSKILELILNRKPDKMTSSILDTIGILKNIIINRLNIDNFEFNKPQILEVVNIEPTFKIIIVKVLIGDKPVLLGTEMISM